MHIKKNRIITVILLITPLKKGDLSVQIGYKSSIKACASISLVSFPVLFEFEFFTVASVKTLRSVALLLKKTHVFKCIHTSLFKYLKCFYFFVLASIEKGVGVLFIYLFVNLWSTLLSAGMNQIWLTRIGKDGEIIMHQKHLRSDRMNLGHLKRRQCR